MDRLKDYPTVPLVKVLDVNHYDVVSEKDGANRSVQMTARTGVKEL